MKTEFLLLFRDIRDGFRSRPGRTAFGLVAVGLGMMSLTLLLAALGGLREKSAAIEKDFGADVLAAVSTGASGNEESGFRQRHLRILEENLEDASISQVRGHRASVSGAEGIRVVGTDHNLLEIRRWKMAAGRWLDPLDIRAAEKNAVLTSGLSRRIGKSPGDFVNLGRTIFRVVGVLAEGQGSSLVSLEAGDLTGSPHAVYVPSSVIPAWDLRSPFRPARLDAVILRSSKSAPESLRRRAERLFTDPSLRAGTTAWISPVTLLANVRNLQKTVQWTAGSITLLCLLLGGMTLASLMAANVRERVPEIGLRLTLGATPGQIAGLFIWESSLLTMGAAVLGTGIALICLTVAGSALPVPVALGMELYVLPPAAAVVLGIVFAWIPARSAAAIRPSEALRNP
jgi:putative ABC transport system permease protein